jgi:diguanylate cyclase (GGDEF)-like protein
MPDGLINSVILPLEIKTIIFVVGIQCICQAAIFIYLWLVQKTYLPAKHWALGAFLRAVGLILISTRDIMPLWASIVFGNSFLIIGDLCFNFGIAQAAERKPPWRVGLAFTVGIIVSVYWCYFVTPDLTMRIALIGLAEVSYEVIAIYACLRNSDRFRKITFELIALLLTIHSTFSLWRIFNSYATNMTTIFLQNPAQVLYACSLIIFVFLMTALLILLTTQRFQKELLDQSRRDFLTNAFNRRAFEGIVVGEWSRALRHGHPTSFLMVDIDHFKKVNDQYGHSAGDNVLVDVSNLAQTVLRQEDTWCRYGGEEFAVMLPETAGKEAAAIAERLRCVIEEARIAMLNGPLKVTVSIGASERTSGRTRWTEVLEAADQALYKAKSSGRNCVVFTE